MVCLSTLSAIVISDFCVLNKRHEVAILYGGFKLFEVVYCYFVTHALRSSVFPRFHVLTFAGFQLDISNFFIRSRTYSKGAEDMTNTFRKKEIEDKMLTSENPYYGHLVE
jgi:hypothetical protein